MPDLNILSITLRQLLGQGVGIGSCNPRAVSDPLWAIERPAMDRATPKRLREFAAGRMAARAAMIDIGLPPAPIAMHKDRAPIWPDGLIGSISHCQSAAIAAVAPLGALKSIGIDVEENTPLTEDLWNLVCTKKELNWLATQPPVHQGNMAKLIFVAKEAIYKAQYPLSGRILAFEDIEITQRNNMFTARIDQRTYYGRWVVVSKLIICTVPVK